MCGFADVSVRFDGDLILFLFLNEQIIISMQKKYKNMRFSSANKQYEIIFTHFKNIIGLE